MAAVTEKVLASLMIRLGMDSTRFGKDAQKAKGHMNILNSGLKQIAAGFATAFSVYAIGNFLKTSLDAFDQQAKAAAKVAQAIKSTGEAAGKTFQDIAAYASKLQRGTIFGDEQILNDVQAQLLTFTNIAGDVFDRTTKAALDLSTVLGTDLRQQSIQLGKAINDPVTGLTALRRSGISFTQEQTKIIKGLVEQNKLFEAQTLILDELNRQYGGQAEAAARSGLGAVQQAKNSFSDIKEIVGQLMAPGVIKSADLWKEWFELIKSPDVSAWDKWRATFSNMAKHNLYEEMGFADMMEATESENFKRWENLFGEKSGIKNQPGGGFLIPTGKRLTGDIPTPGGIEEVLPLLDKENKKLEELRENWELSMTEDELSKWGRMVQLQEEEVKRLQELGRETDKEIERKKELLRIDAERAKLWLDVKSGQLKPAVGISGEIAMVQPEMSLSEQTEDEWRKTYEANKRWQEAIQELTYGFNQSLKYMYEDIAVGFGEALGTMIATGKGMNGSFLLAPIADMMSSLGKLAISAGITALAIDKALKSPQNGYAAIAAGIALVALAAGVRAGMSNIASGGGGGGTAYSTSMSSGGQGAYQINRNIGENPVIDIYVHGDIRNDVIEISNRRGAVKFKRGM